MGLEIFAAALSAKDLIRGDYVASRVGSYIKEGAQLNAKLVKEALQARSLELAGHSFNRDIISEAQAVRRDIFAGFAGVEAGLEELKATFDWGFGQAIWQLELQTETLKDILEVLQAPLDTQAKELRRRAEHAYQNGWIDEAERDFLESEKKNYQDFSVHFSLGMIYLYHKIDFEKALKYFRQTTKYAKPASSHYAAQGWFYTGFALYLQHKYSEAIEAMNQALKFNPEFSEAHYQIAKNFALLSKPEESIENLRKAILADKDYCLKADMDKDFDGIRSQVNALFELLKQEAKAKAMGMWNRVPSKDEIEKVLSGFDQLYYDLVENVKVFPQEIIKAYHPRDKYGLGNLNLVNKMTEINPDELVEIVKTFTSYLWDGHIYWLRGTANVVKKKIEERNLALSQLQRLEALESNLRVLLKRESYFDYLKALLGVKEYDKIAQPVWSFLDNSKEYCDSLRQDIEGIDQDIQREQASNGPKKKAYLCLGLSWRVIVFWGMILLGCVIGTSVGKVLGFFLGGITGGFIALLILFLVPNRI